MRYDLDKFSYDITSRSHWNLQGLATWGSYPQKLRTVQMVNDHNSARYHRWNLAFYHPKMTGFFFPKKVQKHGKPTGKWLEKMELLTNQLWIETCQTPTGWVVGPPPGTAVGFTAVFHVIFLDMQKLTCNFQEKCFFRARTVVCAHASFLVAFCFSCNCRWTRYDLQQTVPYLGLKKSGQNIQSVAYTLITTTLKKSQTPH